MYNLNSLPLFDELKDCKTVLLAGAGGGFDIFSGLPIYYSLKKMGIKVVIANYSFTWLRDTSAKAVFPYCYEIEPFNVDKSGRDYFPELYLKKWLIAQGDMVDLYAFDRTGVKPLNKAYKFLQKNTILMQ